MRIWVIAWTLVVGLVETVAAGMGMMVVGMRVAGLRMAALSETLSSARYLPTWLQLLTSQCKLGSSVFLCKRSVLLGVLWSGLGKAKGPDNML